MGPKTCWLCGRNGSVDPLDARVNTQEVWRNICGYEGLYQVSNAGRVRSLDRQQKVKTRYGGWTIRKDRGQIIVATDNGHGYKLVGMKKGGKSKNKYVHRLVAEAFLGTPHEPMVVNHKNHNRGDNRVENLEWCTQKANVQQSADRMRHPKSSGRSSNTGEKYISARKSRGGGIRYIVTIKQKNVCKRFSTMDDALEYRKRVIKGDE